MKTLILSLILIGAAGSARAALTPDEQNVAKTLTGAAKARYTDTRNYVHRADAIIHQGADPLTLGRKPANVDTSLYVGDEASWVEQARDLSNIALMSGIKIA